MYALTYSSISEQFTKSLEGFIRYQGPGGSIRAISTDTRTIQAGDLFVALIGQNMDGHDYIDQAITAGATGVVVSHEGALTGLDLSNINCFVVQDTLAAYGYLAQLHRRQFTIPLVGITGSCGKTTVKTMLKNILSKVGSVLCNEKNFNNEVGVPRTLLELTTEHQAAVVEMGARKVGDIAYLAICALPTVGVITNVGPSHLETFGSLDVIAATKGELYEFVAPDGTIVLNIDEAYAPFWLSRMQGTRKILTFGCVEQADITCLLHEVVSDGIQCTFTTDIGSIDVQLPCLGEHNISNALAAIACARALDVPLSAIQQGLATVPGVSRRLEQQPGINGATLIDDSYNANPTSMQAALEILATKSGKKIFVLGDMMELGEITEQAHRALGKSIAGAGVQAVFAVGQYTPYTIETLSDYPDIEAKHYASIDALMTHLKLLLDERTIVLIKGSNSMNLNQVTQELMASEILCASELN